MKQTTVVLTEKSQVIKEDLAPIFGLKNILSAGLLLFGSLTAIEQKLFIELANKSLAEESSQNPDKEQEFRRRILKILTEAQAIPAKKKLARKAKSSKSA